MSTRPVDSRIGQFCDLCQQVDDHPRHHIASPSSVTSAHFDCCAANGCESCAQTLTDSDNAHGAELIAHLTKGM